MKKYVFFYFLLMLNNIVSAQKNVEYPLKFFSLRNSRFSFGIGFELPPHNISESIPSYFFSNQSSNLEVSPQVFFAGKVALDLFAPHSILNLYTEVNYSYSSFTLYETRKNFLDTLSFGSLEVPLFLKIRTGTRESRNRFVLFGGGSIDLPLHVKRTWLENNRIREDKNKEQLAPTGFNYGGGVGWETHWDDHVRSILYFRATFRQNNLLNKNYPDFILNYNNIDIKYLRLTLALSIFF